MKLHTFVIRRFWQQGLLQSTQLRNITTSRIILSFPPWFPLWCFHYIQLQVVILFDFVSLTKWYQSCVLHFCYSVESLECNPDPLSWSDHFFLSLFFFSVHCLTVYKGTHHILKSWYEWSPARLFSTPRPTASTSINQCIPTSNELSHGRWHYDMIFPDEYNSVTCKYYFLLLWFAGIQYIAKYLVRRAADIIVLFHRNSLWLWLYFLSLSV